MEGTANRSREADPERMQEGVGGRPSTLMRLYLGVAAELGWLR